MHMIEPVNNRLLPILWERHYTHWHNNLIGIWDKIVNVIHLVNNNGMQIPAFASIIG